MKNGFENIKDLLSRYFEGIADGSERNRAEEYLLAHPEVMDKYEEIWGLRLHPLDESADFPGILLKSPEEFDDNQFLLLAAAAEEGDLSSESLSDFKSILESSPEKQNIVAEFHDLKLRPENDSWSDRNRMLHTTPVMFAVRRGVAVTLAAAAVLTTVLFIRPAKDDIIEQAGQSVALVNKGSTPTNETGKKISEQPSTVINIPVVTATRTYKTENKTTLIVTTTQENIIREKEDLIALNNRSGIIPQIIMIEQPAIILQQINPVSVDALKEDKGNWMLNGLNSIASVFGKKGKPIDSFALAGEGIKEINKLLGWNMALERETGASGEVEAFNFSSNLLSFSKSAKKNIQ
jgi:hypothetical protein